jgi:hypothetical protein
VADTKISLVAHQRCQSNSSRVEIFCWIINRAGHVYVCVCGGRPAVKNNNTHITLCYTTVGKSAERERAKRASIIWASDVKASVSILSTSTGVFVRWVPRVLLCLHFADRSGGCAASLGQRASGYFLIQLATFCLGARRFAAT